jgi:phytoene dehydrogenase-like protein
MPDKSIIIIGGGIAGLSAGCYARMNGYSARIFEMHTIPGGLCTAWKREGYTIDGCLHWLVGSSPASNFYPIWEDLGAVQGRTFIDHDEYLRVAGRDGRTLVMYCDIDRFERHLLELSPADAAVIRDFARAVRVFCRIELPVDKAPETFGVFDGLGFMLKIAPRLGSIVRWAKVSLAEFASRFSDPLLREGFPQAWMPEFSMLFVLFTFAWMHRKVAGYPLGGSLPFALSIEKRFKALGGEIEYKAKAAKVLVENGRATGVRLEDGTEHRADNVISAADGHFTVFELLDGRYADDTIRARFDHEPIFPPLVHVALGVNRRFDEIHPSVCGLSIPLESPIFVSETAHDRMTVEIHNFDPGMAPPGKTVVRVMFDSEFEYWRRLREDEKAYVAEKDRIADSVVAALDRRFPGLAARVEMRDVATPLTFRRYTGNWQGSFEGWQITPANWKKQIRKTLPGLEGFYMCGQWVEPGGGIPAVAMSGRNVVQIICKKDGKKFTTTRP